MDYKNIDLMDLLNGRNFKMVLVDDVIQTKDLDLFKSMFTRLINEKRFNINSDLKQFISTKFLKKRKFKKIDIEKFVILMYTTIKCYDAFKNTDYWDADKYFYEITVFKMNKNLIDLNYFNNSKTFPKILDYIIDEFVYTYNHYLFQDYFIYALKLGMSIGLIINMKSSTRQNNHFLDLSTYYKLCNLNHMLYFRPSKEEKNYFKIIDELPICVEQFKVKPYFDDIDINNNDDIYIDTSTSTQMLSPINVDEPILL
jgi:hypothetical protein